MSVHIIEIEWEGPYSLDTIIEKMKDAGNSQDWSGNDYGLYQIYGNHILCGKATLLYVGKAVEQTFSQRFSQHKKDWLNKEQDIEIYLGRAKENEAYSKADNWKAWEEDIGIAELVLIYKYSPNYNSACLGDLPKIYPYEEVQLVHLGNRNKIHEADSAPKDYL